MKHPSLGSAAHKIVFALGLVFPALTCLAPPRTPPTISDIPDQRTFPRVSSRTVPFVVGDATTPAADLVLVGASSNTNLVPNANIVFGGSGSNRTVTATPREWLQGLNTITVTVIDSQGDSASRSFFLTVADFTNIGVPLTGLAAGSVVWGDYDGDGDLDVLQTGKDTNNLPASVIYRNDAGVFTDIQAGLQPLLGGEAKWGDYDNDGDLDLALGGRTANGYLVHRIYRNDDNDVFSPQAPLLNRLSSGVGLKQLSIVWGDYDNDGDLDVLFTDDFTTLYRNDRDSGFTNSGLSFPTWNYGAAAFGDSDNDGDLDLIVMGTRSLEYLTRLYRNDGPPGFGEISTGLPPVTQGGVEWGDYDGDGRLDLLFTGITNSFYSGSGIYTNGGNNTFSSGYDPSFSSRYGSVAGGDYDNNGQLDFILNVMSYSMIYHNLGDLTFTGSSNAGGDYGYPSWGDYDKDGDLDVLLMGRKSGGFFTAILRNDGAMPNTPPGQPFNLGAVVTGNSVVLSWSSATDAEQSSPLTYNVRIGTSPGGFDILGPMSDPNTGYRQLPAIGNAGHRLSSWVTNLSAGTYYWSVQAIDHALAGGAFAPEQSFTVTVPTITSQPQPQTVAVGDAAVFSVGASGTPPLLYQWRFNGANFPGATNSALCLTNIQPVQQASYSVVVSNAFGYAVSSNAFLTVLVPPAITGQPQPLVRTTGASANFSVAATGSAPLGYRWFFNETPLADGGRIGGAATAWLSISNLQAADGGSYFVVVSNSVGAVTSSVAMLTVGDPPVIVASPESATNVTGDTMTLTVSASGTGPLGYRWRANGSTLSDGGRIGGSSTATLVISNALITDVGAYDVVVTNIFGATTSLVAQVTMLEPPAITVQPPGRSVPVGAGTTFTAGASGTAPLAYQWQFDGVDIPDATNLSYTLVAVAAINYGDYRIVVSNAAGVAISSNAPLVPGRIAAWGLGSSGQTVVPVDVTKVVMLAAGYYHSVALLPDGTVRCWGLNNYGQADVPAGATNVVAVAAGGYHTLALQADGRVLAWGQSTSGQLIVPAGASNVVFIAAGTSHSLAVRSDGGVLAWGSNSSQQSTVPANLAHVVAVSAGSSHSLVLKSDGIMEGWGNNSSFQAIIPSGLSDVAAIASGSQHNLVLHSDGTVSLWGSAFAGTTNAPADLTNVTAVAAANNYNLALRTDGMLAAWGQSPYGQTNVPGAASNVATMAAGYGHVLALIGDGSPVITRQPVGGVNWPGREHVFRAEANGAQPLAYQWTLNGTNLPGATNAILTLSNLSGVNDGSYQLVVSNALGVAASLPVAFNVLSDAAPMLTWPAPNTTFLSSDLGSRLVLSATAMGSGPLGYQWFTTRDGATLPVSIPGATNADLVFDPVLSSDATNYLVSVSNTLGTAMSGRVTLRVGSVRLWGNPNFTMVASNYPNPVQVAVGGGFHLVLGADGKVSGSGSFQCGVLLPPALNSSPVTAIAASGTHALALRANGTLFAWGCNSYGLTNVPPSANNVVAMSCGFYHDLALRGDGTIVAWGNNTYGVTNVPSSASNVVAVAAGGNQSLALRSDGTVVAWGQTFPGQTGVLASLSNVVAIAAGYYHSLALRADGTVVSWGQNSYGVTNVPAGLSNVVAISASLYNSSAVLADGSVVGWGNGYGGGGGVPRAIPPDLVNVVQISETDSYAIALFGTRAPFITIHPYNRSIYQGASTLLAGKASAAQPATYHWLHNGAPIAGATNDTLQIVDAQFSQAGAYQLVVSNQYGVTASKPAKLFVTYPLPIALDTTNLTWSTSNSLAWFGQPDVTHDGQDAARSADIGHGQETFLQTTVSGPGQLSFWWKVSSEAGFDLLQFRINGVVQTNISGEVDWQQKTFALGFGTSQLQWRYGKDASSSAGFDAAWVDEVTYVPNPPVITVHPISQTVNAGANVSFGASATGAGPIYYQWQRDGSNVTSPNVNSGFGLASVGRAQRGLYRVLVSNGGGTTISSNAALMVIVPQQLGSPSLLPDGTIQFSSVDADGGLLTEADLANMQVQISTNLTEWTALPGALTLTDGMLQIRDSTSNAPARYYRLFESW